MSVLGALRATGFDPPFGTPAGAHPGVRLESHFWRIVDEPAGRVVLALVTRCRDAAGGSWAAVALAVREPDGATALAERVVEDLAADPGRLALRARDGSVEADGGGVRVDLGPSARLDVAFAEPRPWSRRALGGLGLGHVTPGLTQYWHPHLLGARVRGDVVLGGARHRLDGARAYGEKNWGRGGVPAAWWWGQAFVADDALVAFAGGLLDLRLLTWRATALAVRLGDELHAWAPPQLLRTRVDTRRWRLDARNARGVRVLVEAVAPGAALDLPVPVPAERRTAPLSHQHQDGRLRLTVWRGRRLALREEAGLAGLERGGPALPRAKVLRSAPA